MLSIIILTGPNNNADDNWKNIFYKKKYNL